jgi:GAF domain-containing protein
MNRLAHVIVRPILEALADRSFNANGVLPRPPGDGHGHVYAPGPDADRVLLVGTAAARGLGVATQELALAGQLARRLSADTNRGVDLELFGDHLLRAAATAELITSLNAGRFDAVVLEIGSREAVGLLPVAVWRRELRRILTSALSASCVFLIGIPPIPQHTRLPRAMARSIGRKIAQLNEASRLVVAEFDNVIFVPIEPLVSGEFDEFGSIEFYEQWARLLAPVIAGRLAPELHPRRALMTDESARQAALDELGLVGRQHNHLLDEHVRAARGLLGASGASLTLIDHDRHWMMSVDKIDQRDIPRAGSFCDATIQRPELFVVEDASQDERFASNPLVVGRDHVRFYAGYPIEAPDGHRIGALCVVDTQPRQFSQTEGALLRDLAVTVQGLLWELAAEPA